MPNLSIKQKIIGIIVVIGTILILIFKGGIYSKPAENLDKTFNNPTPTTIQTDTPEIISTSPSPLDNSYIWGTTAISITFNLPIENIPELKYKFEPASNIKTDLSNDNKTVTFTPIEPLKLGSEYLLTIPAEAKFLGKKTLGKSYIFHIRTIEYKGV
ncbi:MAG: Ig-like domain-containing protein [Microgenomates group bacterium]|jgi:hypothetical protein